MNSGPLSDLLFGGTGFFMTQVVAVVAACVYAFLFTYIMLFLINLATKVKVATSSEDLGLDAAEHGEKAYDEGVI